MELPRRRVLTAGAALAGGIAGCVGNPGTAGSGGGGGNASDGTTPGLTLPALDVAGSPGGEVVVEPADTVVLLDFFATWCAPCKPQMKHLRTVHERFPDVHLLSITSERDEAAIKSFWREYEGTWPVAQDLEARATAKYEAGQLPTMLVLDRQGEEVWRHVGLAAADSIAKQLRAAGAST